jgi:NAD(P)-dependent dehydrogenase (short-subunit alcohol dehydrogenase family)
MHFAGKVVVVTGAGRGIGRAEAELFATEGAHVVVNDVDAEAAEEVVSALRAQGLLATAFVGSASDEDTAAALVAAAIEAGGQLDVLVNNAGITRDGMAFNLDAADWDAVISVHQRAHFLTSKHAALHWRSRSKSGDDVDGRIINTSSEAGLFGTVGQLNYAAAKAAIAAMTLVLARELERYGVRVNAIVPRARTRMTASARQSGNMLPPEEGFDSWDAANIAPAVAWLASDGGAEVTGHVLYVFGSRLAVLDGWHPSTIVEGDGRWSIESIDQAKPALFKEIGPGLPPSSIEVLPL